MTLCHFTTTAETNILRCTNPGCERNSHYSPYGPERTYAPCGFKRPKKLVDCPNFGPEIRRAGCEPCGGNVQIKLFHCLMHGECQIESKIDGVRDCKTCPDKPKSC